MRHRWLPVVALLSACASGPRFKDQPIVWRVDDTRDIAAPEPNAYSRYQYLGDVFVMRRSTRTLELRRPGPAKSTNALDEVPDSTWFTNRIGVRPVSPAEAAIGPGVRGPPVLPLSVSRGKSGGGNPGFVAKDRTGRKFVVKFDTKANPEQQTATDVIVSRLFWAFGYNVPADYVLTATVDQFALAEGATLTDPLGDEVPFTPADLEAILESSPRTPDGRIRAIASEFLPGKPIGGWDPEGVRSDDPNDTIPHEDRRELRALRVIGGWLNHTDMKEDNTLDMWVEENGRRFVRHYFVDFGEAFAAHAAEKGRKEDGYEHFWDWAQQTRALFSFGLWVRPWERLSETPWPAIGVFSAEHFHPEDWHEAYPYWPIVDSDDADAYWAAKIVMRFDRPIIEAIVGEAKLSSPEAAAYLVDTLLARKDKIGRAFLDRVTPLEEVRVRGREVCAVDSTLKHRLAEIGVVEVIGEGGEILEERTVDANGSVCWPLPEGEGYRVQRLRIRRGPKALPPMELHVRAGASSAILGLVRLPGGPG